VRFSSANAIGPGINEVRNRPELIAKIRKLGKEASVWTVDGGADIELCKELGVDNLITNTPAHARTFL
jgi:glycerophosphoryl diester phosphodiesterase